jgi:amidase
MQSNTDDITSLTALALSSAIHDRRLSCREVMQAYLNRIHRLNPGYSALIHLAADDELLEQADARDAQLARGESMGWMHGMPHAIKNTAHVLGFPSDFGCPLLQGVMPQHDQIIAQRIKSAGAIIIGKTNIPELGLGSHTFNKIHGTTRNAWDVSVSAGGSSGGAAVALAHRMLPVADGSDFMGSLRNPAGWNNVFGMRPSQGLVPRWPRVEFWLHQLAIEGPMARNVPDLAQLLSTLAGEDARDPMALGTGYAVPERWPEPSLLKGLRIGWLGSLNDHLALEPGVLAACEQGLSRMTAAGAVVEPLSSGLGFDPEAVWEAWLVWRRALTAANVRGLIKLPGARELLEAKTQWEYDQAQGLSYTVFEMASEARSVFYNAMLKLLSRFDVLALPVAQVWPFPSEQPWPTQIAGRTMDTYHRWMECTIYATMAGLPAISVPAGFDVTGRWPMGLQLIGQPRGDGALIEVAAAYEVNAVDILHRRPPVPGL